MDWGLWVSVSINGLVLAVILAGRNWIEASVEKSIQHRLDEKLEATKSELRAKEGEISALRDMVLSGTVQRRALLDKRKLEAVERIWASLTRLAPFVVVSRSMRNINFDQAAKRTPDDPKLRQFFELIAKPSLIDSFDKDHPAIQEQPFLSPLAWAYYSAYQSILMSAYSTARVLAEGVEDAGKLLKRDHAKGLLKAILPHQSDWIDSNDPSAYDYLLDEIKDLLLLELRNIIDGQEADREAVEQGKRIAEQIGTMQKSESEQIAALAKMKAEQA